MTEARDPRTRPLQVLVLATADAPLADLASWPGIDASAVADDRDDASADPAAALHASGSGVAHAGSTPPTGGFAGVVESALGEAGRSGLRRLRLRPGGQRELRVSSADPAQLSDHALIAAAVRADVLVVPAGQVREWPSPTLRAAEIALLFGIPLALLVDAPAPQAATPAGPDRSAREPRHDARCQRLLTVAMADLGTTLMALAPREPVAAARAEMVPGAGYQANCVWLAPEPLLPGRRYTVRVLGAVQLATVARLRFRFEPGRARRIAVDALQAGETGVIELELEQPQACAPFAASSDSGGVLFEDPHSGAVLGFALLTFVLRRSRNVQRQEQAIDPQALARIKDQNPCVLWLTGISGAGKSTVANQLQQRLHALKYHTCLLDGDNVRHGLNRDLGFTAADRVENIRRVGEVARLMVDAGLIVITAFISPFRAEREMVRSLFGEREFIEIFIDTPLAVAEQRDPKGLYRKARSGELKNFTGIDSPYEAPEHPEIRIDTTLTTPAKSVQRILVKLRADGRIPRI